jgi:predicted nucleotidyltransferase
VIAATDLDTRGHKIPKGDELINRPANVMVRCFTWARLHPDASCLFGGRLRSPLKPGEAHSASVTPPRHATELVESDANHFAEHLSGACSWSLDHMVDGIVLHGSLVRGDYTPGRGDIDLLVICGATDGGRQSHCNAVAADARRTPKRADVRVDARGGGVTDANTAHGLVARDQAGTRPFDLVRELSYLVSVWTRVVERAQNAHRVKTTN